MEKTITNDPSTPLTQMMSTENKLVARELIRTMRVMVSNVGALIKHYEIGKSKEIAPILTLIDIFANIPAKDVYPVVSKTFEQYNPYVQAYVYNENWFWDENVTFVFGEGRLPYRIFEDHIASNIDDDKKRGDAILGFKRDILCLFNCFCRSEKMEQFGLVYTERIRDLGIKLGQIKVANEGGGVGLSSYISSGSGMLSNIVSAVGKDNIRQAMSAVRDGDMDRLRNMATDPELLNRVGDVLPEAKELAEQFSDFDLGE